MKKLLFLILCSLNLNVFSAESADGLPHRTLNDDRTKATLAAARYGFQLISRSQSNNCECKHKNRQKKKAIKKSTNPFTTFENGVNGEPSFLNEDLYKKLSELRELADMHKDILDMKKNLKN
jgi:hypothetical protein